MNSSTNYLNCNPYDTIDNKIKLDFQNKYNLELKRLYYNQYGIVDNCFLLNLIGESKIYNVFLGYRDGNFFAVKVIKRSIYESNEILQERIEQFYKELNIRDILKNEGISPIIYHVNYQKGIIYEEFLCNGHLSSYFENESSEKKSENTMKSILYDVYHILCILKKYNLKHESLCMSNLLFDYNYNLKIIGFRDMNKSIFINSKSINNEDSLFFLENKFDYIQKDNEKDYYIIKFYEILTSLLLKERKDLLLNFLKSSFDSFKDIYFDSTNENNIEKILFENEFSIDLNRFVKAIRTIQEINNLNKIVWLYNIKERKEEYEIFIFEMIRFRPEAISNHYKKVREFQKRLLRKKIGIFHVYKKHKVN